MAPLHPVTTTAHAYHDYEQEDIDGSDEGAEDAGVAVLDDFCKLVADCRCNDYKSLKVLKSVIGMLHNEAFDLSLFRARIKNLQSCQESHNSKFYEKAERDGLRKEIEN